jgi:hypothetical protein
MQPPIVNNEPTPEVAKVLLKSEISKITPNDGDLLIVRIPKSFRNRLSPAHVKFWMKAAGMQMKQCLDNIGKPKTDVIFLDEGVKLEQVPAEDLKKIAEKVLSRSDVKQDAPASPETPSRT